MKNTSKLIILTLLLMIVVISCDKNESKPQTEDGKSISVKAHLVKVGTIELKNVYTGTLEGEKQTVIYAKISEAVDNIHVKEGETVKQDQVLISLDKTGPSSNYMQAKSLYQNAEKNYKKIEFLYNQGAVSELDYDASQTDYKVKKASFESASRLVDIVSPIAGMVTSIDVSKGDYVTVGQKLATVAQSDKIRVKFNVNLNEINNFSLGSKVLIEADNFTQDIYGEVIAIANSADPVNRAFEVEALIDNADHILKPGMFVRIQYIEKTMNDVILIPRKSIVTLDNMETVFIVQNGKAFGKAVKTGAESDGQVIIDTGLQIGDTLVILGQDYLENNSTVNISEIE